MGQRGLIGTSPLTFNLKSCFFTLFLTHLHTSVGLQRCFKDPRGLRRDRVVDSWPLSGRTTAQKKQLLPKKTTKTANLQKRHFFCLHAVLCRPIKTAGKARRPLNRRFKKPKKPRRTSFIFGLGVENQPWSRFSKFSDPPPPRWHLW